MKTQMIAFIFLIGAFFVGQDALHAANKTSTRAHPRISMSTAKRHVRLAVIKYFAEHTRALEATVAAELGPLRYTIVGKGMNKEFLVTNTAKAKSGIFVFEGNLRALGKVNMSKVPRPKGEPRATVFPHTLNVQATTIGKAGLGTEEQSLSYQ